MHVAQSIQVAFVVPVNLDLSRVESIPIILTKIIETAAWEPKSHSRLPFTAIDQPLSAAAMGGNVSTERASLDQPSHHQ